MIEPMLVLSTAHVTEHTCNTFLPQWQGPAWQKGGYGWFLYVVDNTDELPTDLEACLHLARSRGCFWVMLDRDAPAIIQLPTFDW